MLPVAAFVLALGSHSLGDLQITNFEPGAEVRYPVVILRGTTASQDVAAGLTWKTMIHFPVAGGKFVAAVELKPGLNMVMLASGDDILKLRLDYKPMTTPNQVVCAYIAPKDDATDYDAPPEKNATLYGEKLDTALKLLQGFTAEAMNDAGFGRKTFPLEFGENGRLVVHVIRTDKPVADLRATPASDLFSQFEEQLESSFPAKTNKTCAFLSFSRYDRRADKLLGECHLANQSVAMFDSSGFAAWPSSLSEVPSVFTDATEIDRRFFPDETGGRGVAWAFASTTMGGVLNELGRTFGLADSPDPQSVMSDGFNEFSRAFAVLEPPCKQHDRNYYFKADETPRWDSASAAILNKSPWFQPDALP
jgi:hypothetical protein